MLAVDTNVVVRYVKGDDVAQSPKAKALIESSDVFISLTVLLETEWVLRRGYGDDKGRIAFALRQFAGGPHVHLEAPERVDQALNWMAQGMDFADALHLAGAGDCTGFVTFDKGLAAHAIRFAPDLVRLL